MDNGAAKIEDPSELAQIRRQARRVHIKAVLSAIALTLLVLPIPPIPISTLLRKNNHEGAIDLETR